MAKLTSIIMSLSLATAVGGAADAGTATPSTPALIPVADAAPAVAEHVEHPTAPRRHVRRLPRGAMQAHDWASSLKARSVSWCESNDEPTIVGVHSGVAYYGKWQANASFWTSNGGPRRFLGRSRFSAPVWLQDLVAFRGWRRAGGWSPWACA